jgi:hypothetical protein
MNTEETIIALNKHFPALKAASPRPLRAYEDGRPHWKYNSHPHTMGNVDSTPVVVNQLEFCQAIGMGEMGGLPRASCPVRPDGHPDRVACEDYLREGPPTRDSRNGQDCTPNRPGRSAPPGTDPGADPAGQAEIQERSPDRGWAVTPSPRG